MYLYESCLIHSKVVRIRFFHLIKCRAQYLCFKNIVCRFLTISLLYPSIHSFVTGFWEHFEYMLQ